MGVLYEGLPLLIQYIGVLDKNNMQNFHSSPKNGPAPCQVSQSHLEPLHSIFRCSFHINELLQHLILNIKLFPLIFFYLKIGRNALSFSKDLCDLMAIAIYDILL